MDFILKSLIFFTLMVGIRPQRNSVVQKSRLSSLKLESLESSYDDFMKFLRPIAIPRVSGTENNFKVRNYLISQMQSFGWHIDMDNFTAKTPFGDKPMSNIIATLPIGRHFDSDQKPNPLVLNRVIFACHYDSKYFPNFDFIAATDSAVPCAMLLDMAKFLFENSNLEQFSNLIRHIQFIFFDGEEAFKDWTATDSLYGSRNYADKLSKLHQQTAFDSMDLFVLMDLFGGDNSKFPNYFPSDPTSRNAYLLMNRIEKVLIKKKALSKSSQYYFKDVQGNGRNFPVDDDHRPFLRKNVPILHLIPSPFPSVWHTQWDTVESLNKDHIQDMRKMMKYFLMEILNKESKKLKENEDL